MNAIAIIILNYNNFEDTINCIDSVEKINTAPIKYIIVDNGSPRKGVVDALDKYFSEKFSGQYLLLNDDYKCLNSLPYCTFLASKKNSGYACGNKKGLKLAYGDESIDTCLILNNDVLFVDDFIPVVYKQLWSHDEYLLATPLILQKDGIHVDRSCARRFKSFAHILSFYVFMFKDFFGILNYFDEKMLILDPQKRYKEPMVIDMPCGSNFMGKKEDLKRIDDFDPHTFLYYEEDILAAKMKKLKKKCVLVPSVACIHLGSVSANKCSSKFIFETGIKSTRYYVKNYMGIGKIRYCIFYAVTILSKCLFNLKTLIKNK